MPAYPQTEQLPAAAEHPEAEIRRSARRRKTVSARWEGDRVVLLVPAGTSTATARRYLLRLMPRLRAEQAERGALSPRRRDEYLQERARALSAQHLGGRVRPTSIRWVTNQNGRWGSTTPARGTIRVSHQLWDAPEYVVDYVVFHELCHLIESSHNQRFRGLEALYPHVETAQAFLTGLVFGRDKAPGSAAGREPGADGEDAAEG